ncbi:MAG: tetratricopeptide repeat protein [Candidatus Thiodiazotropha sp. (ex Dulcina madagascariensis)]|nr:tetratricopeptide repeat protein [Candidatus Thiodiazotropha sp. (ex Dulcina madagascariensis)]
MPKLNMTTWIVIGIFQVFYGFVVFSMTRSYYQEESAAPRQTATSIPAFPAANTIGGPIQRMGGSVAVLPDLSTDDPQLLAQLADSYFAEKNYQQAIKTYERSLEINPDDVETYNDLGLSLHYTGQSARAIEILKTGISKGEGFQRIYLTMGFVQAQTGDKEAAKRAFAKAVELGSDNRVGQEAQRMLSDLN